jgi:hypothetical protein
MLVERMDIYVCARSTTSMFGEREENHVGLPSRSYRGFLSLPVSNRLAVYIFVQTKTEYNERDDKERDDERVNEMTSKVISSYEVVKRETTRER